ncbi:MAG: DUF3102 domain-containing protein [Blastocatellia bacterium]
MTTQQTKPAAQGTPPPISEKERREIESRGWVFHESDEHWYAINERLEEQTQEAASLEDAVECILAIEYQREQAKGQPTLTPLGELMGFIGASSTGRKRDETEKRFPMNLINQACRDGHIAWEANRRRYIIWNKPMPQASEPEVEIDFDLVPNDPHRRNWSSLSDADLGRWMHDLAGMKGANEAEWRKRIEIELELRDSINELMDDKSFELPVELTQPRSTYADALRHADVVKAEQQRRIAGPLLVDVDKLKQEVAAGSLDAIDADHTMNDELPDYANSLIAHPTTEQMSLFDYAQLDDSTAIIVRRCTEEIRARVLSIKHNTREIGARLREVKSHLERGTFDEWLDREIGMSRDTADRLIQYVSFFEQSPHAAEIEDRFDRTAVYLLVAPSVPDEARIEATARAQAGEQITPDTAREIVKTHRITKTTSTVTKSANNISKESTTDISGDNIPPESQLQESTESIPQSIPPVLPVDDAASQSESETESWNAAVIKINLTLFKHDGDASGRRVMMSLGADDDRPEITWHREVELFRSLPSGSESLPVRDLLKLYEHDLPSIVTSGLANIAIGLPARAVKQPASVAPPAKPKTVKPAAKKSATTAKKPVAKQSAAKKPASKKKATSGQKDKKKGGGRA